MQIGLVFRAIRREQRLRQVDVAARAGVAQQTISNIERGSFADLSVDTYCAVANAIGASISLMPKWRGPKLARLIDRRHAWLQNRATELLDRAGWQTRTELTFNDRGDRGSVDILGWRDRERALLIVEIKSEIDSLEETLRRLNLKHRVVPDRVRHDFGWAPALIGLALILPDGSTHRDLVRRHEALISASLPARSWAVQNWIAKPAGALRGVLFLRDTHAHGVTRNPPSPDRVRPTQIAPKCPTRP